MTRNSMMHGFSMEENIVGKGYQEASFLATNFERKPEDYDISSESELDSNLDLPEDDSQDLMSETNETMDFIPLNQTTEPEPEPEDQFQTITSDFVKDAYERGLRVKGTADQLVKLLELSEQKNATAGIEYIEFLMQREKEREQNEYEDNTAMDIDVPGYEKPARLAEAEDPQGVQTGPEAELGAVFTPKDPEVKELIQRILEKRDREAKAETTPDIKQYAYEGAEPISELGAETLSPSAPQP
eukprot:CAMPEP_0184302064 /NCGR_PEP_ID=MMETSP1049-20130417/12131_1 /TAXON_ID=77928 /ORGANISM="Proteomonas sulcata, Strain CCMP704" /LENGTH=242 /DNA_ID=CAMNT_0026613247 /DNA_START=164 /DNA_END=889 /DNA_ORIENTATION=+